MLEKENENDIVLARFIKFMEVVFHNQSINYFRKLQIKDEWEEKLKETEIYFDKSLNLELYDLEILTDKEKNLFELHYKRGLTYMEISKITGEKILTLKQRRNRAIAKLQFRAGGLK